jgi:hypoxanthine phosphoribosyltransferase
MPRISLPTARKNQRPPASPTAASDQAEPVTSSPAEKAGSSQEGSRAPNGRARTNNQTASQDSPSASTEAPAKPKRKRGSRGGRRHRRGAGTESDATVPTAAGPTTDAVKADRRRKDGTAKVPSGRSERGKAEPLRPALTKARARIPVTGAPTEEVPAPFAHNAEYEFARILDFYGIDWQYEPRSFALRWDRGHVTEAFTPDFYLPDLNLYVELTTLKTSLTAEKNRKMRLLKELYPEVNVIMLKKRDYLRLLAKYGYGPLSPGQVPEIDRVLLTATKIQQRVGQIGAQISRDYAGKEPVLVGVLRGVMCFISDLMRHISVPVAVDLMAVSSYEGNGAGAVRILKDLDENIKGRDVILVEDIVDTGMTLNHVIDYLQTKRPASIRICTLLDKRARRIVNVPLDYVAFEIPDEFVVGYGLDFHQRFRNLPFIALLKHELLP